MNVRCALGCLTMATTALAGCSGKVGPTGGLMLVFRSDGTVHPNSLHVEITSADGSKIYRNAVYTLDAQNDLPTTLAIASNGDATAAVVIDASIWLDAAALDVRQNQVFEIPTDRVAELDVDFSASCSSHVVMVGATATSSCPKSQTCNPVNGGCGSSAVNAANLPTFGADAEASEAAAPPDDAINDGDATVPSDAPTDSAQSRDQQADVGPADATVDAEAGGPNQVTLTMSPLVVSPGQELYGCQSFGNPFGGYADLISYDETVNVAPFRFFVFSEPLVDAGSPFDGGPAGNCPAGGLEFHPFAFFAQSAHTVSGYPDAGMGYPLAATNGLTTFVHYANTGTSSVTLNASVTITAARAGDVTTHVGSILLNNAQLSIPPGITSHAAKTDVPLSTPYNLISSWSYMTQLGVMMTATANGSTFYSTTQFAQPPVVQHLPYLPMDGGTGITWDCTFNNNRTTTVTFGESAVSNAMCIYVGQYFPANPSSPDVVISF